jgi:ABC-type Fe3+ transport system permease subunit
LHYLGHAGAWHAWLPFDVFSLAGAIWVLSLLFWPPSFFLIWGAWQRLEAAQLESDLLVRGGALMRVLLLPLAREAIVLATLLIFAMALNNFAVPAILQVKVLPAEMWVRFNTEFDTLGALKASYPLLVVPALLLLLFRRRTVAWPNVQGPVSGELFRRQLGPVWWCVSGCSSLALLFSSLVLPLFQILSASRTWSELFGAIAAGQGAIENSVLYSLAGATSVTGMALVFTALEANGSAGIGARISRALGMFFSAAGWLAFLLPGVLLGIGLIYAFNHDWSARIYQSCAIVIVAFTIRYFVIGHYAVGQASRKIDPNLLDAAQIDGASRWQMVRHAIGPQIFRPLLVSWYLIFLLCLWDVESMILVVPPGGETLALRIFNLLHYGHNAQVNALCLTLLLVALLPLVSAFLFTGLRTVTSRTNIPRWPKSALVLLVVSLLFLTACAPNSNEVSFSSNLFATVQVIGSRGVGVG